MDSGNGSLYASAFANNLGVTMRDIHEYVMSDLKSRFETLCHAINREASVVSRDDNDESISYSAYKVKRPFTVHRVNLVHVFYHVVRFDFFTVSQLSPSCVLQHIQQSNGSDVFTFIIDWFFDYPNNNIYHRVFTDIICEVIYYGEEEIWEILLRRKRLLTRMLKAYHDQEHADYKGHITHILNLLRLYADSVEHHSFLYRFLKSHNAWRSFEMELKMYTLRERNCADEREIKIGSEYAKELGFVAGDLYQKPQTLKQARRLLRKNNRDLARQESKNQWQKSENRRRRRRVDQPMKRRLRWRLRVDDDDDDDHSFRNSEEEEHDSDSEDEDVYDVYGSDEEYEFDSDEEELEEPRRLLRLNPYQLFSSSDTDDDSNSDSDSTSEASDDIVKPQSLDIDDLLDDLRFGY